MTWKQKASFVMTSFGKNENYEGMKLFYEWEIRKLEFWTLAYDVFHTILFKGDVL